MNFTPGNEHKSLSNDFDMLLDAYKKHLVLRDSAILMPILFRELNEAKGTSTNATPQAQLFRLTLNKTIELIEALGISKLGYGYDHLAEVARSLASNTPSNSAYFFPEEILIRASIERLESFFKAIHGGKKGKDKLKEQLKQKGLLVPYHLRNALAHNRKWSILDKTDTPAAWSRTKDPRTLQWDDLFSKIVPQGSEDFSSYELKFDDNNKDVPSLLVLFESRHMFMSLRRYAKHDLPAATSESATTV